MSGTPPIPVIPVGPPKLLPVFYPSASSFSSSPSSTSSKPRIFSANSSAVTIGFLKAFDASSPTNSYRYLSRSSFEMASPSFFM
jgi:hypothetical protein